MNVALWELAGPRLWASRVGDATAAGKSVIVLTQQVNLVPDLGRHLSRCLTRTDYINTHVQAGEREPLDELLSIIPGATGTRTMRTVFERLSARTLVVAPTQVLPAWTDFMIRFQHFARSCPATERPRIVLVHEGLRRLSDDVALESHDWDQVVTLADMESLVQAWLPPELASGILRKVLVRTIAEIALSDVDLIRDLCRLGRGDLGTPIVYLEQWGRGNAGRAGPVWLDGKMRDHILKDPAGVGLRRRLSHRIWRAQASVLLPWVEEQRQAFLPKLEKVLPEKDDFNLPRDEFEVGTIYFWLKTNRPTNQYFPLFERLRKVRNYMAHCRYLPLEELQADIFFVERYR